MNGIKRAGIAIDSKVMADLEAREPADFQSIVESDRAALAKS
jgi:large subunit ribosomal protein L20